MTTEVWVALIGASAALLAVGLIVVIVIANWRAIGGLMERTTKLGVGGLVLEFAARELRDSKERPTTAIVSERLRSRAQRLADRTTGMRVLWVDDKPLGNAAERGFLRAAGMTVVNAVSTQAGLAELDSDDWDLVITNFTRGDEPREGILFQQQAEATGHSQPFLGYVGHALRPFPSGFVAVVDQPEDLINHVLDIADRRA